jgi:amino acid adenylation domain-containing protein
MPGKENIKDIYALSPLQAGMFFHALYEPTSPAFFEQMSYRFRGALNLSCVEQSLDELMKRYDILRTVFIQKAAHDPLQVVLKERKIDFRYQDISGREDKEDYLNHYKAGDRKNVFDLGKDSLMRVAVLRLDAEEHEFTWSFHHILMDGWCTGILVSDFSHIYSRLLENKPPGLPGAVPYRAYIDWLGRQDKEKANAYWKKYLANYEVLTGVPGLKTHQTEASGYKKGKWRIDLEREKTAALERAAGESNVFLNTILQAAWGIILGRYNDTQDVVFGAVVSGRPSEIKGVETIVGLFINTVPVRITFGDNPTFRHLLQKIREEAVESAPFHYSQLAEIQARGPIKPLLDHIFVFENYPTAARIAGLNPGGRTTGRSPSPAVELTRTESFEQTNYDLDVVIGPGEQLIIIFEYNANIYDDDFIARVGGHLTNVLDQVLHIGAEELRVDEIDLLTGAERNQLLVGFNTTETPYPFETVIQQLFEDQVFGTPYRTAVVSGNLHVTYRALNTRANQLARRLRRCGVGPGSRVGLLLEPAVEMVTGITAVLKAGGAFVPLDTNAPYERNRYILEENKPAAVLIQTALPARDLAWLQGSIPVAIFPIDDENLYTGDVSNLKLINMADDTAMVLYTSGTTGRPRGILLTHRNVHNFNLGLWQRAFGCYGEGLSFTSLAPLTFDGYGQLIFCALWYGHRFCILPGHYRFEGARILEFYRKYTVDFSDATPAHLRIMVESVRENRIAVNIKNLIIAGEVLPKKTVERFLNYFDADVPDITNCYGPTECCGDTTHYRVTKDNIDKYEAFPIGTPLPNERVYIVDSRMRLQPIGIFGELCIGGDGVAKGYLNNPELTAYQFDRDFQDLQDDQDKKGPASREKKKVTDRLRLKNMSYTSYLSYLKLYRTGDLCRWLPDGNIEFLGRKDFQVKVRGFRIEPGEIEARLMKHEKIEAVVVTVGGEDSGDRYLCAYIVSGHGVGNLSVSLLREYLSRQLPGYMIPSYFVLLESIPLRTNGKVDRRALPDPMGMGLGSGNPYTAPRDEMEEKIAVIWADVLNREVSTIGIHDNFFELGGNSITILKIAARIREELGLDISVGILFLHPTIGEIAANIHEQSVLSRLECVIKLNRGGAGRNIFIIHPYHGMVYPYRELARLLEGDYNVYGIQARGLERDSLLPVTSSMMVADYIDQIRQVQVEGPFIIAGFCFGSIVAYEIVNQLEAMDYMVEKLIFFDEHAFIRESFVRSLRGWRRRASKILNRLLGIIGRGGVNTAIEAYVREVNFVQGDSGVSGDMEMRKERVEGNNRKLEAGGLRISGIIRAPILDIKAEASRGVEFEIGALSRMSGSEVRIIEVPGDHDSIFTHPYVGKVAEIIKNLL